VAEAGPRGGVGGAAGATCGATAATTAAAAAIPTQLRAGREGTVRHGAARRTGSMENNR